MPQSENRFCLHTTLVAFFSSFKVTRTLRVSAIPAIVYFRPALLLSRPSSLLVFTDNSSSCYASRYSTVSLCQYKLKNTTFPILRVYYQLVLDKYGMIKAMQLFYGTYFILSVVFQLKLAATSKTRLTNEVVDKLRRVRIANRQYQQVFKLVIELKLFGRAISNDKKVE